MITDVQVAPNLTDDAELLERALDNQAEREINVEKTTTDGGYTGPVAEAACDRHGVDLRATRMRGGQSAADRLGWEAYTWTLDDDGQPVRVTCPEGQTVELEPGQTDGRFIGRFDPDICATCPLFNFDYAPSTAASSCGRLVGTWQAVVFSVESGFGISDLGAARDKSAIRN